MKKLSFSLSLFLILMNITRAEKEYSDIQILQQDASGIVFKYVPEGLQREKVNLEGRDFEIIRFSKTDLLEVDGIPQLPVRIVMLGVPLEAKVQVRVVEDLQKEIANVNLPVPKRIKGEESLENDNFKTDLATGSKVEVEAPFFVRDQRVVRLKIYPCQYRGNTAIYSTEMTIAVEFTGSISEARSSFIKPDRFEKIYRNLLLNYQQAGSWRREAQVVRISQPYSDPFTYSNNWYKVFVSSDGVYKIDQQSLRNAGINLSSLDPRSIRIFSGGGKALPVENSVPRPELKEMAIFVQGEEDVRFDASDYILFYGWSVNGWEFDTTLNDYRYYLNPYTKENVYWLTFGGTFPTPPLRIQTQDGSLNSSSPIIATTFQERIHREDENLLYRLPDGGINDYFTWYWMETNPFNLYFSLTGVEAGDSSTLKIRTEFPYPFLSKINGIYTPIVKIVKEVAYISTDRLNEGTNQIEVFFSDRSFVDYFEVQYTRRTEVADSELVFRAPDTNGTVQFEISNYDLNLPWLLEITDGFQLKKISGYSVAGNVLKFQAQVNKNSRNRFYLVNENKFKKPLRITSALKPNLKDPDSPDNQADYLIITHSDFISSLSAYEAFRETASNVRVKLVNVQEIYDHFSYGLFDPTAIRDFLRYAYKNWNKPAPAYVLLVGDGSYDYKNNSGLNAFNWIPPYMHPLDISASDENYLYFGSFGYLDSDSVSSRGVDMIPGRWPVKTPEDVNIVAGKIMSYEQTPEFGTWRNLITVVADDEFGPPGSNTEAFHTVDSENLILSHTPSFFNLNKVYLVEYPFDFKNEKPEAQQAIINSFNNGTLIINYFGHGNPDVWAHEHVFQRSGDIPRLTNRRRLPLIYTASCSIGFFDSPASEGMGEELLRTEEGGAIGVISATRLVYAFANRELNYKVYDLLLGQDSLSIAEALYIAKYLRQVSFGLSRNDRQYLLFGDPLTRLASPRLKVILKDIPDTVRAVSLNHFTAEVTDASGNLVGNFNGTAYIQIMDAVQPREHTMPDENKFYYTLPGRMIFRGSAQVNSGKFAADFLIPKDVTYGAKTGKISIYVSDGLTDGAGSFDSLFIQGSDTAFSDTTGPEIEVSFTDQPNFQSGDFVGSQPTLNLEFLDPSGINLTGELGHGIILKVDETSVYDLTGAFEYDLGDYQKGKIVYSLNEVSAGLHNLKIKAWDNLNNSEETDFSIQVEEERGLKITEVMNYPNPFSDKTNFTYQLSDQADGIEIKIYTLAGRLIKTIKEASNSSGYNFLTAWDGRDEQGDKIASGVYIYKIIARKNSTSDAQREAVALGKLVIKN